MSGEVATQLILEWLADRPLEGASDLTDEERLLIDFRYGACDVLGNVNVGFLEGNGPAVQKLIDNLYEKYARGEPLEGRLNSARELQKKMELLRLYRNRRSTARAAERRENRQRSPRTHEKSLSGAEYQADRRAAPPGANLEGIEELEKLLSDIRPRLRKSDLRRLDALAAVGGDRAEAAKRLGLTLEKFNRQMRQTTIPNCKRLLKEQSQRGKD